MKNSIWAVAVLAVAGAWGAQASVVYSVGVNTSTLKGQAGFLDFGFLPGNSDVDAATATVSSFVTDGVLASSALLAGDVTPGMAALPGGFSFVNDQFGDDLFQGITFGNLIRFTLTLSGAAVDSPNAANHSGTTFAFSLYNGAVTLPLLTNSVDGAVSEVNAGPGGQLTTAVFPTATGGSSVATVARVAATPEPRAFGLLLVGMSGLWVMRRR